MAKITTPVEAVEAAEAVEEKGTITYVRFETPIQLVRGRPGLYDFATTEPDTRIRSSGIAVTSIVADSLGVWITAPDAPNFFVPWARVNHCL